MSFDLYPQPQPSSSEQAQATRRAASIRDRFLRERGLQPVDCDGRTAISRMATDLADHWRSGRVRGRDAKEALGTLARIADDYGQPGPPSGRDRDLFAAGFSVYAKLGTAKAVLVSAHAARLGTDEIRQIDRFRRASFDVLATDDEWSSRRGIRVLIAAPLDLRLNPEPELDGELRPGRSFPQSHVRLRASRTGDTAHTPRPDPNGERH